MTPDEIQDAIDLAVDCMDYAECSDDDVDKLCGYVSRMANEIKRLQALLPQSDDGEPVTAEWLIESGFAGEHKLGGCFTLHVYSDGSCSIECDSGQGVWYRFEESCDLPPIKTRGDARRLAAMFGVKLREGTE